MVPIVTPLIAVLLPVIVLYRCYKELPIKRAYLYSIGSFASALTAICLELAAIRQRAVSGDFGGIEDTIGAVLVICIGIMVVTVLLNLLTMAAAYGKDKEKAPF